MGNTICDRCALECDFDETYTPRSGEWDGCVLCNECQSVVFPKGDPELE